MELLLSVRSLADSELVTNVELTRRDFLRAAGTTAIAGGLLAKLSKPAFGAPVPARFTVRYIGANVKPWLFDKSRRYRREQIAQLRRWGFEKLRDNNPYGMLDVYDINHFRAVAEECLASGVEYTISGADANPGLENLVTQEQLEQLMVRFHGKLDDVRRAITALGIACNNPVVWQYLLDNIGWLRGLMPVGVRMQAFNGPEMAGFGRWNVYNPEFREFAQSIGFTFPSGVGFEGMEGEMRQNYENFVVDAHNVWGDPWLGESNHVYEYNTGQRVEISYSPWNRFSPVITEWGINRFHVQNRADAFRTFPLRVIQFYADQGVEVQTPDGTFNVEEMFLLGPLDPRFLDQWQYGDTRPLWNLRKYAALRQNAQHQSRGQHNEYDAIMMDAACSSALRGTFALLKANRGTNRYRR